MPREETWRSLLAQTVADNRSGARGVTASAAAALIAYADQRRGVSPTELRDDLRFISSELVRAQPAMASLIGLLNGVWRVVGGVPAAVTAQDALREASASYVERLQTASEDVSRQAAALLASDACVLTISASSTVASAIERAHADKLRPRAICLESRPMFEGRGMAARLAKTGVPVTLMVDAAAYDAAREADVIWLGVDALSAEGVIAKLGSAGLALAAREAGRPVYALADWSKVWPGKLGAPVIEPRAPQEVWSDAPAEVRVSNRYFDLTDWRCVSGTVFETGLMTPAQVIASSHASDVHHELLALYASCREASGIRGKRRGC